MVTSLVMLCALIGPDLHKPFTIEIEGKRYKAVIIEEATKEAAKEPDKEKLVWMELNGTPIQVTQEDYDGRFDKPQKSDTGWNYDMDKPCFSVEERERLLKRLRDKPSDPLYNFTSDELQAMDEQGLEPGEDYGRPNPQPTKSTSKYAHLDIYSVFNIDFEHSKVDMYTEMARRIKEKGVAAHDPKNKNNWREIHWLYGNHVCDYKWQHWTKWNVEPWNWDGVRQISPTKIKEGIGEDD